jgi:hypothetical protein
MGSLACSSEVASAVEPKALIPHIFEESAIWTPTLNTSYQGERLEGGVDLWHSHRQEAIRVVKSLLPSQNIAVARLGIIFRSPEGLNKRYVDLPCVYLSGWDVDKPREGVGEGEYRGVKDRVLAYLAKQFPGNYRQFASIKQSVEGEEGDKDLKYAQTLREVYDFDYLELTQENMKGRMEGTLGFLDTVCNRDGMNTHNAEFARRFYDTEQGIYLELQKYYRAHYRGPKQKLEIEDTIVPKLLQDVCGSIEYLTLDIATFTDMCMDCSDTALMQSRFYKGLVDSIKEKIVSSSYYRSKYTIKDDSLISFIRVSSTAPTSKQRTRQSESYLNLYKEGGPLPGPDPQVLLSGYMEDGFLNPLVFKGYIAQMKSTK